MASRIFLTASIFAACVGLCFGDTEAWESFKRQYGRQYGPEEEAFRRRVFADNLALIGRHNAEFAAGRSTFWLGVNQFADMTGAEFSSGRRLLAERPTASLPASARRPAPRFPPGPDAWDWRWVPIRAQDQGPMESSWPLTVASAVEVGLFLSSRWAAVPLSMQNLFDCVPSPGSPLAGLEFARDSGLAAAADYPDVGAPGPCQSVTPAAWVSQVMEVPPGDEDELVSGLLWNPVPVLIDATHFSFQMYAGGIYSEPNCSETRVDHSVLLVGYGNASGTGFLTLANSWGSGWGEGGYMRIEYGTNMCGVASYAAYPWDVHP